MRAATAVLVLAWCAGALAGTDLTPFSSANTGAPPAAWRAVGLAADKAPLTHMDIVALDGRNVLRLRTDKSYGTLTHALAPAPSRTGTTATTTTARWLQWQWRLDQPLARSDLRRKDGDDAALKVCALFDLPLANLGFAERSLLRLARSVSGEHLPGATVCYVWDTALPVGERLANAYSRRVRYVVLDSGQQNLGRWFVHQRNIDADFLASFGDETPTIPPLLSITVGADADNTGGASLGYLGDISLQERERND